MTTFASLIKVHVSRLVKLEKIYMYIYIYIYIYMYNDLHLLTFVTKCSTLDAARVLGLLKPKARRVEENTWLAFILNDTLKAFDEK